MAEAPKTTVTYPLDGANRDFLIPFEYLARKFVQVTLVGVDRKVLTLNIDYRFTQRTIVTLTKNWGPSDGYSLIEVRRYTSATERLVDFSDGSILRAYDLNTSQVQSLHIAEEGRDIATDTIGVNNDGDLDARGRKIVNVADGTGDFDAVNLRQQKQWAGSALNQADRAQREADRSTQQANASQASNAASAAQAQESLKWANESSRHAGLSKASAEASQTSNVQSFQNLELSRAQVAEATRQAGLATSNGAAQVTLATTQANRSRDEANRSTTQANASAASAVTSKNEADRSTREADRAKTEADKLGNMNALASAIREVNVAGTKVEVMGGWEWNSDVIAVDRIRSRGSASIAFNAQLVGSLGASFAQRISTAADVQAAGEVAAGVTMRIRGQGSNAHLWFMTPDGAENALIYAEPSGALHIRSRSQGDTLTLNVDRSMDTGGNFRIRGEGSTAGRHTAGELLSNGNVWSGGGQSWVASDGNVYGPVWGGYLSTWANNQLAGKQPKHHFQSGRVGVGAPGGGYKQFRINFHQAMAGAIVQITIHRPALHVAVGVRGESWVDAIDANGFTCWVHCEGGEKWDTYIDWIACQTVNVGA
ncbi:tail fiber protein [Pseudomonas phage Phi-S1]|uniref:Tail fiber protein n=1 Tax=Pseudomonas phage Phi-S1 TaxID=1204538 RepID=M4H3V8_9CAUD|nr:tail fiber protein [Pseudomonas phage Phi-S1]AFO12331.1 tail fiber protein [Pseudomonas phage Phi-S1]